MPRLARLRTALSLAALVAFASVAQAAPVVIENFDDGDISNYTILAGLGALPSTSAGAAHDGPFGLEVRNEWWMYRTDAAVQVAQGTTLSAWVNFDEVADARAYFGFGASAAGTLSLVLAPNTNQLVFQENPGYGFADIGAVGQTYQADKWYRAEVQWQAGGTLIGRLFDSDGVTLLNTVNAASTLFTSGGIAFRGFSNVKAFDTISADQTVPEPASLLLLGSGLAVLARRRRQSR